jgi:hypothetical protein
VVFLMLMFSKVILGLGKVFGDVAEISGRELLSWDSSPYVHIARSCLSRSTIDLGPAGFVRLKHLSLEMYGDRA